MKIRIFENLLTTIPALVAVLVYILGYFEILIPENVAAAIVVIIAFLIGLFAKDK